MNEAIKDSTRPRLTGEIRFVSRSTVVPARTWRGAQSSGRQLENKGR